MIRYILFLIFCLSLNASENDGNNKNKINDNVVMNRDKENYCCKKHNKNLNFCIFCTCWACITGFMIYKIIQENNEIT